MNETIPDPQELHDRNSNQLGQIEHRLGVVEKKVADLINWHTDDLKYP